MPVYQFGDVVYAPFPFQEGNEDKDRPVLVLVPDLGGGSLLICMISKSYSSLDPSVEIKPEHILSGEMDIMPSFVRTCRLFSTRAKFIRRRQCQLRPEFVEPIRDALIKKLTQA